MQIARCAARPPTGFGATPPSPTPSTISPAAPGKPGRDSPRSRGPFSGDAPRPPYGATSPGTGAPGDPAPTAEYRGRRPLPAPRAGIVSRFSTALCRRRHGRKSALPLIRLTGFKFDHAIPDVIPKRHGSVKDAPGRPFLPVKRQGTSNLLPLPRRTIDKEVGLWGSRESSCPFKLSVWAKLLDNVMEETGSGITLRTEELT